MKLKLSGLSQRTVKVIYTKTILVFALSIQALMVPCTLSASSGEEAVSESEQETQNGAAAGLDSPAVMTVHPLFGKASYKAQVVAGEKQDLSKSELLFFQDNPVFKGSVVTGNENVLRKTHSTILLFTGIGGNVESYGSAAVSTIYFCNLAIKMGFFPVVVENPVYLGARAGGFTESQRLEIAKQYSYLPKQVEWFNSVVLQVANSLPPTQSKFRKLFVVGRSSGQSLTLEVAHRAYHGNQHSLEAMKRIDTVILSGLNSHAEPFYSEWTGKEDKENRDEPKSCDPIAVQMDRSLYEQESWADASLKAQGALSLRQLSEMPSFAMMPAKLDHYLGFESQMQIVAGFAKEHARLRTLMIPSNGKHDPTASFKVGNKKVRNGDLLSEVLKYLVGPGAPPRTGWEGLRTQYLPHPFSPLPHELKPSTNSSVCIGPLS